MMKRCSGSSLAFNGIDHKMEEWQRAKAILRSNPNLMTSRVLLSTLHNKPPVKVIQFMLELNPQAAAIPKHGPTALQIAIQYGASVDVIVCLLKACPFALLVTGSDEAQFPCPLEYAKMERGDEADLIHVLSQSLSYWMTESNKNPSKQGRMAMQKRLNPVEKEELNNIKVVAATILKAQKRQTEALEVHRHELKATQLNKEALLKELELKQQDHFKTQLVALDMKERAMRHKNRSMERRIIKSLEASRNHRSEVDLRQEGALKKLEASVQIISELMDKFQGNSDVRINELEKRLEKACKINDLYRKDTHLQLDQMEHHAQETNLVIRDPPFVFAKPFLDKTDKLEEPLFGNPPRPYPTRKRFWPSHRRKFEKLR